LFQVFRPFATTETRLPPLFIFKPYALACNFDQESASFNQEKFYACLKAKMPAYSTEHKRSPKEYSNSRNEALGMMRVLAFLTV